MAGKLEADSKQVVEEFLHLGDFFAKHKELIFEKLEKADSTAEDEGSRKAGVNGDILFFAESLPVINGLLQIGAKRADQKAAEDWVRKTRGDGVDPLIVLSAMTLIYVAEAGSREAHGKTPAAERDATSGTRDPQVWDRILRRVKKQIET